MNVIRHDHIATYGHLEIVLGALRKKYKSGVDLIPCQKSLSFVCTERDEIKRTRCEDSPQTRWPLSQITFHSKSYNAVDKIAAAMATALRAVLFAQKNGAVLDRPQAGGYSISKAEDPEIRVMP